MRREEKACAAKGVRREMRGNDLGRDRIGPLVLKLAIPSMLAQLVNVLYGVVDRIYISNIPEAGEQALAGIGVSGPISTLITSFALLVGIGGAPLTAMRMGEGNQKGAEDILANCTLMLLALSAILTGFVLAFREQLLMAFGASEALMPYAEPYLRYLGMGTVFSMGALGLNQFIICQGYSTAGMMTVMIGAAANIALDPLFIFGLDMGCAGAAIATVLSQMISFGFVVWFLLKKARVRIRLGGYSARIMKRVLTFGFSPFVIGATDSIFVIGLNSVLQRYGGAQGDSLIAAATITQSYMQLITMPLGGLSGGTQPLLSFNFGARKVDRIRQGEKVIVMTGLIFTAAMFLISQFAPGGFARIFTSDEALIETAAQAIRVYTMAIIPLTLQYCFVDGLTALGIAKVAMTLSVTRKGSMLLITLLIPMGFGAFSAFWAEPIADLMSSIISSIVFLRMFNPLMRRRMEMPEDAPLYG